MEKRKLNLQLRAIEILSNLRYRSLGEEEIFFNKEEQNEIITDFIKECVDIADNTKGVCHEQF